MARMKRDNMTKQQIDQFRAEQKNKMEERRSLFDRKVIHLPHFSTDVKYRRKNTERAQK